MRVVEKSQQEITIDNAFSKAASGQGILIYVWQGKHIKFCSKFSKQDYRFSDNFGTGFRSFGFDPDWGACTEGGVTDIISRFEDSDAVKQGKFYYFKTLGDFARAAIENGWEL